MRKMLICSLMIITALSSLSHGQSRDRRDQPVLTDSLWQVKYSVIIAQADSVKYLDPEKARDIYSLITRNNSTMLRNYALRAAGSFADTSYGYSLWNILNYKKAESDDWHLAVAGLGDLKYKPAEDALVIQRYRLSSCIANHSTTINVLDKAIRKIRGEKLDGNEPMDPKTELIVLDSMGLFIREGKVTEVIGALAYPGNSKAVAALSSLLKNPKIDIWARGYAAYGLGQIGDKKAIPALVELCKTDTSDVVISQAIEALGYLGAIQARDVIKSNLKDQRIAVRRAAIVAAGIIKSPELFAPLLECAKQEKEPQAQVYLLMALGQVSKNIVSPAQRELERTLKQAGKEGKKVFLAFYCNQCTNYCPVMDSFLLNASPMKEIMGRSYVYMKVETGNKNGEQRLVDKYVGPEMEGHYPYYVILDKNSKVLETSLIPGKDTVGWPEKDWEIAHFVETIRNTGKVKKAELQELARQLKERYERIRQ